MTIFFSSQSATHREFSNFAPFAIEVTPGDAIAAKGRALAFTAKLTPRDESVALPAESFLVMVDEDGKTTRRRMTADDARSSSRRPALTRPWNTTRSSTPASRAASTSSSRHQPSPITSSAMSGTVSCSSRTTWKAWSICLCGTRRARTQIRWGDGLAGAAGRGSRPLWATWTRSGAIPRATRSRRELSDTVTCTTSR